MVLLPCGKCCKKPIGCVLTGFSRALTAFNLASGLSKSYDQPSIPFAVTDSYDDSPGGDSRLKVVIPGTPVYLAHVFGPSGYTSDPLPLETPTGPIASAIQLPTAVSGFADPNQASVSFRFDGSAVELRLLLYLQLPYSGDIFNPVYQTQQVRVVYRKTNQRAFFESAQADTKITFGPGDITSFSSTALTEDAPVLTIQQSDIGTVTVGFFNTLSFMYGEFVVTATAENVSYSFDDSISFSGFFPTTKTLTWSAAGYSGIPFQAYNFFDSTISFGGNGSVGNCTKWSAKLQWGSVSNTPTQYALYILFGDGNDTWSTAFQQACFYASSTFHAGLTNVAFALLKTGNTVTVTLPAPYWPDNGRTYWHAAPGFGLLNGVMRTETEWDAFFGGYSTASGIDPGRRKGLPFRHGAATLTVTQP